MGLQFEWDPDKSRYNLAKHGVSFQQATTAFADPLSVVIADPLHSAAEERQILVGLSALGRLLVVVHTYNDNVIRIISARLATRREKKDYEEGYS